MKGLYNKYEVKKTDGTPIDPKAEYFVLRVDKDPAARFAIRAYARFIHNDDPVFADELRKWVDHHFEKQNQKEDDTH